MKWNTLINKKPIDGQVCLVQEAYKPSNKNEIRFTDTIAAEYNLKDNKWQIFMTHDGQFIDVCTNCDLNDKWIYFKDAFNYQSIECN